MSTTEEAKELIYGNIRQVELPSGYWVKIREQNGEDDDIISNPVLAKDLTNVSVLLSSLIIETNLPFAKNGKLSLETVDKMLVNDQAVILLASRINSLGSKLDFHYTWPDGSRFLYSEDLEPYLWEYITRAEEFPYHPDDPEYFEHRCKPYLEDAYGVKEFTLQSGKKVRMKQMDILSQKALIKLPAEKNSKNAEFIIRNLELEHEGKWTSVKVFKFFSSRDMQELRQILTTLDNPFRGLTELENPNTGDTILYPFMGNPSFFFPGETVN